MAISVTSRRARVGGRELVIAFSLILIRAPYAIGLGESAAARLIFMLPLFGVAALEFLSLIKRGVLILGRPVVALGVIVVAMLFVAIGRAMAVSGVAGGQLAQLAVLSIALLIGGGRTWRAADRSRAEALRYAAVLALPVYVGVNVLGFFIGWRSPLELYTATPDASMLRMLGITVERVLFPMAAGWNAFGLVAGGSLAASIGLLTARGPRAIRVAGFGGTVVSVLALLLCDSRAALVFATAAGVAVALFRRRALGRLLPLAPVGAMGLPVVAVSILILLPTSVTSGLSRSGYASDIVTLSNRTLVWQRALQHLSRPQLVHLVGYGHQGQVTSGVSLEYSDVFGSYTQSEIRGLHNMYLQLIFDVGYVGLAITLVMWVVIIRRLLRSESSALDSNTAASASLFIYFALAGSTDRVPVFYVVELWFVAVLIGISVSGSSQRVRLGAAADHQYAQRLAQET